MTATATAAETQESASATDHNSIGVIFVPAVPDTVAQERVHAAIAGNNDNDPVVTERCTEWPISCQVRIDTTTTNGKDWILTSLDSHGNPKSVGGDEFYVAYTANNNNNNNHETQPYTAVAWMEDRQNGTYRLDFCATPTSSSAPHLEEGDTTGGTLTIYFQYSCGIGRMAPPSKQEWTNGGYTHRRHDVHLSKGPPIRPFVHPNSSSSSSNNNNQVIDLNNFDLIVAFGDSTMEQFVRQRPNKKGKYYFQHNLSYGTKVAFGLNTTSVSQFLELLEQGSGSHLRDATTYPRRALVVGSGLWDILDSKDTVQGATQYEDHRQACRNYLSQLQHAFPDVTILWKSPTAVHIHVVDLERLVVSQMGEAALFGIERLRYMSASRSQRVYEIQKQIVLEAQRQQQQINGNDDEDRLFFLDLYEATYLSADWLFPSDGRHYRPDLNRFMLQWFYRTPPPPPPPPSSSSPPSPEPLQSEKLKDDIADTLTVSSDGKGGFFLDNIPKPYFVDPTCRS